METTLINFISTNVKLSDGLQNCPTNLDKIFNIDSWLKALLNEIKKLKLSEYNLKACDMSIY